MNQITTTAGRVPGAFSGADAFENAQRMAKALTASTLVPKEYQGAQNLGNAIIALELAQRIGASPLMVMQNLYVVHGRPAWSAQFIIAALNTCGRFKPLQFEMFGEPNTDARGCRVKAVTVDGDELDGPEITLGMAKAEGWTARNGSKWKTLPEQMLRYRAASFFGKLYAPDVLMGMGEADEIHDTIDVDATTGEITGVSRAGSRAQSIADALAAAQAEHIEAEAVGE